MGYSRAGSESLTRACAPGVYRRRSDRFFHLQVTRNLWGLS